MFNRLRTLLGARLQVGDLVTVLDGPYAGKPGSITAVNGQAFSVFVDECCQPQLSASSLRRVRASRRSLEPGEPEQGVDDEHEVARAHINQLPPPMV